MIPSLRSWKSGGATLLDWLLLELYYKKHPRPFVDGVVESGGVVNRTVATNSKSLYSLVSIWLFFFFSEVLRIEHRMETIPVYVKSPVQVCRKRRT